MGRTIGIPRNRVQENPQKLEKYYEVMATHECWRTYRANTIIQVLSEGVRTAAWNQGNRVLTKEHLEEVVLDPTGFKPFTLDTPFESGFLLQHIGGNLA